MRKSEEDTMSASESDVSALDAAVQQFNERQELRREGYLLRDSQGPASTATMTPRQRAAHFYPKYSLLEKEVD